ncbi:MAG TPA: amidohydrolase family protein [Acidimicrobiia bacterium]|nr:amidohydrolase family protein [Acidimicrobiia bacterium]
MIDLLIRGGTLVDGSGTPPRTADVAVTGPVITEVGRIDRLAGRVIDADGALVTPGFVDVHSHYDGQATWDTQLLPSAWHGVTTVVMGNCGVGFAPVRPADHDRLIELMEGVEDIPGTALHEGLTWEWETFAQYLDVLSSRAYDIDVGAQVPHGALRLYVMGERAVGGHPATEAEIAEMAGLARAAIDTGALGFTTSRTRLHRSSRGELTPSLAADEAELVAIAAAVGAAGAGVLQVVSDLFDLDAELGMFLRMVEVSRRPLSISLAQADQDPDRWRVVLERIGAANHRGLPVLAQVAPRPIGLVFGFGTTLQPFMTLPSFAPLRHLGPQDLTAALSDPDVRRALLDEAAAADGTGLLRWDRTFTISDPPDYEPPADHSIAARAAALGAAGGPAGLALDLLLAGALLYRPMLNYCDGNLDAVHSMLTDPYTIPGLADGGAHVGSICDASFPTTMLTHWCRDRTRGGRLDLATAVRAQTARTAAALGLRDRGVVAAGYRADLNVIDFERLTLHAPELATTSRPAADGSCSAPMATSTRSWPVKRSTPTANRPAPGPAGSSVARSPPPAARRARAPRPHVDLPGGRSAMTRYDTETTGTTGVTPPGPRSAKPAVAPGRIEPVKLWAALGTVLVAFEGYLLIRWFTGSDFTRVPTGPDSPAGWMKTELVGAQIVMTGLALYLVVRFVVRPIWAERRLSTDAMACIGAVLVSVYDPASNYLGTWFGYNSYLINAGSPMDGIPGWKGGTVAWPPLIVIPGYVIVVFGATIIISAFMERLRARWPAASDVTIVGTAYAACVAFDLFVEAALFMRLGFYTETGFSVVGAGHYYQMPLWNLFLAPVLFCTLGCFRFFKNDRGQTLVERGAERIATSRKATIYRLLAVIAAIQVIFFATYHLPAGLTLGAHIEPIPGNTVDRSYFTNGICGGAGIVPPNCPGRRGAH